MWTEDDGMQDINPTRYTIDGSHPYLGMTVAKLREIDRGYLNRMIAAWWQVSALAPKTDDVWQRAFDNVLDGVDEEIVRGVTDAIIQATEYGNRVGLWREYSELYAGRQAGVSDLNYDTWYGKVTYWEKVGN